MSTIREKAVVLLSGGLDSTANLAIAAERDEVVLAITVDYGQRAARSEERTAKKFSEYYRVPHLHLDAPWLRHLGQSQLTAKAGELPQFSMEDSARLDSREVTTASAKRVWVPNRNGLLINLAACFAEDRGAQKILVGFNAEEAVTFPDNGEAFMNAITHSMHFSTSNHVRADSYTVHWKKPQIVQELKKLKQPFPFDWVWSCYESGDFPCKKCESCVRLERALQS